MRRRRDRRVQIQQPMQNASITGDIIKTNDVVNSWATRQSRGFINPPGNIVSVRAGCHGATNAMD